MLKRGTKFRIAPYGVCVVSSYDDTNDKYIMRVWNSSKTFYASQEEIDKKCLTRPPKYDIIKIPSERGK